MWMRYVGRLRCPRIFQVNRRDRGVDAGWRGRLRCPCAQRYMVEKMAGMPALSWLLVYQLVDLNIDRVRRKYMGLDDPTQYTDHAHLIQTLSAMMIQLSALQVLVQKDTIDGIDEAPLYQIPDMDAIRNGLSILEQMTRDMLYEVRAVSDDVEIAELNGVTLAEALTRIVEETAESLGLSSRINFSGEERPLSNNIEHVLYRITQEALEEVQRHTNAHRLR